jgi:flagellar basal-body rod modification protein FlgD
MVDTLSASAGSAVYGSSQLKRQAALKDTQSGSREQTATKDVDKDMFLQLMVAQLKNQNPLNPMDGTDFLQQLSQISSVEQMVEMRKELVAIHQLLGSGSSVSTE